MDDFFQKALSDDTALRGLYVCSVSSAYREIYAAVKDEQTAVEMVKEIYISAFENANSYDDFFAQLNVRANKAVKILVDKNAALGEITHEESVFADLNELPIPEELRSFSDSLGAIVLKSREESAQKALFKKSGSRKKEKKPKGELQEFAELVKKHEFSGFDSYKAPEQPKEEKPKSLAEKMQSEESVISDEQRTRQLLEREKNRKASIIAFVFAAVILVGAVATYFITTQIKTQRLVHKNTATVNEAAATEPTKRYKAGEEKKAFEEYLKNVLLKNTSLVSYERIVAYNETANVGLEQLNGIVSAKNIDFDGDGVDEYAVFSLKTEQLSSVYHYRLLCNVYRFKNGIVEPLAENYSLVDYRCFNTAIEYNACNFEMGVKLLKGNRIYAFASSEDMKIYAFHYFENGSMHEAEHLAELTPVKENCIIFQRASDATDIPLYYEAFDVAQTDAHVLGESGLQNVESYGFTFGGYSPKYSDKAQMLKYVNSLIAKFGCKIRKDFTASVSDKTAKDICSLQAKNEQGDKLSRREVVKVSDFTGLQNPPKKATPSTTQATTEQKD